MERRDHVTEVSPSEKTIPNDPERTVVAPRFDQKSIQSAQPAVPLAPKAARRTGPLTFVLLCVVAGLAGGLLGGLVLAYYQKSARPRASAEATPPPSADTASGRTSDAQTPAAPVPPQAAAQNPQAGVTANQKGATTGTDAARPADASQVPSAGERAGAPPDADTQASLRGALGEWVAATNARDIPKQMSFYNPTVEAFYRARNASRESVRAEKQRVLGGVEAVDIRAGEPDIRLSGDGRTATMRFRKKYSIAGGGKERRGEVLQELRWQRTRDGWKIVSERDLRVIQ